MHVLSIDWDFFFPGAENVASDCSACSWALKCKRAPNELHPAQRPRIRDLEISPPIYSPLERLEHLGLVELIRGSELIVQECHGEIFQHLDAAAVINLDAHSDFYGDARDDLGRFSRLNCGNWVTLGLGRRIIDYQWIHQRGTAAQTRHYRGRGHNPDDLRAWGDIKPLSLPRRFDLVFVCRSAPWTPPEWDAEFEALVEFLRHEIN
jgi:hypothetical protein